jgi:hypothetical protein
MGIDDTGTIRGIESDAVNPRTDNTKIITKGTKRQTMVYKKYTES